jgi:hypothetical protein
MTARQRRSSGRQSTAWCGEHCDPLAPGARPGAPERPYATPLAPRA